MKQRLYLMLLSLAATLALTTPLFAQERAVNQLPSLEQVHEMGHQLAAEAMPPEQLHQMAHEMLAGVPLSPEQHEQLHQLLAAGPMTPQQLHALIHQIIANKIVPGVAPAPNIPTRPAVPVVMPDTGSPAGHSAMLLIALGLVGIGLLSRLLYHSGLPTRSRMG